MSLHPNRGGVGKDIEQLTNRSLIDLVNVEIDLDLRHLNGDIKKKYKTMRQIKRMASLPTKVKWEITRILYTIFQSL